MAETLSRLEGAFALAVLFAGEEDLLVAARRGSPLAVGHGEGEMFLGSDAIALAPFTTRSPILRTATGRSSRAARCRSSTTRGCVVERPVVHAVAASLTVDKGNHRHFMLKEIYEQPEVISHTLGHYIDFTTGRRRAARRTRRSISRASAGWRCRPAAPRTMPGSSANTGSRRSPACRSTSISPRSSATARRRSTRTGWRSSSRSPARPPTRLPRFAIARRPGRRSARS